MKTSEINKVKNFYDQVYTDKSYEASKPKVDKPRYQEAASFIEQFQLNDKHCLEVGCGIGSLQDLVSNYVGIDLTESVYTHLHKPFVVCNALSLPFADNSFDAIWSITVLEHVPDPEQALIEMRRVLKPGGLLFLYPAWLCRPWVSEGYPVRPYTDFGIKGKLVKASIPIRNSRIGRFFYLLPRRVARLPVWLNNQQNLKLRYRKLKPNYEKFWMSDSDAAVSIDPFEVILWFLSRGDECISYQNRIKQLFVKPRSIIFRVNKV